MNDQTATQPEHEQVDFVALAAMQTNEQLILGCLQRIEAGLNAFMVLYTTSQVATEVSAEPAAAFKVIAPVKAGRGK